MLHYGPTTVRKGKYIGIDFVKGNLRWEEGGTLLPMFKSHGISKLAISVKLITVIK
jgi:hypothetical protein